MTSDQNLQLENDTYIDIRSEFSKSLFHIMLVDQVYALFHQGRDNHLVENKLVPRRCQI